MRGSGHPGLSVIVLLHSQMSYNIPLFMVQISQRKKLRKDKKSVFPRATQPFSLLHISSTVRVRAYIKLVFIFYVLVYTAHLHPNFFLNNLDPDMICRDLLIFLRRESVRFFQPPIPLLFQGRVLCRGGWYLECNLQN